ncbi:MAG TPA: type II restriction endonuclease [bacterium]|nr:type II restriction endonuclease [bacterium]
MPDEKQKFEKALRDFVNEIGATISATDGQWTVKGFIDLFKNVYTISADTKIVSKILEIHIFPGILKFASDNSYKVVLAQHQNYYPDISLVSLYDEKIKFAVDFKTTYRNSINKDWCNGFTLGSHGEYFEKRTSTKNIQFPYNSYLGHYCLGIIYDRNDSATIDETKTYSVDQLKSITSVVKNFQFFVSEKWKIASDRGGSGNTANIGSINYIPDILSNNGMFSKLGEEWFDDYWINYRKITVKNGKNSTKKISSLEEFVRYRKGDVSKIVKRKSAKKKGKSDE